MNRTDLPLNLKTQDHVRWLIATEPVEYPDAVARMESEVATIVQDGAQELVWLLEHPSLYTAGTSAKEKDLIAPERFPVFVSSRGGQYTYHGPGQRIGYVMLDLRKRGSDIRAFVTGLEQWLIDTIGFFGVKGERREDRVGVWVKRGAKEDKIAALGVRVRRGITFHGVSLNVNPDLSHFTGIVPCGVNEHGVTSLVDLGVKVTMAEVDTVLQRQFKTTFG
jgi:lipoyl(octanoyl) transferase